MRSRFAHHGFVLWFCAMPALLWSLHCLWKLLCLKTKMHSENESIKATLIHNLLISLQVQTKAWVLSYSDCAKEDLVLQPIWIVSPRAVCKSSFRPQNLSVMCEMAFSPRASILGHWEILCLGNEGLCMSDPNLIFSCKCNSCKLKSGNCWIPAVLMTCTCNVSLDRFHIWTQWLK